MNEASSKPDKMGCEVCRATPPRKSGRHKLPFKQVLPVYDTSHSSFTLCECVNCSQVYLEQFHEIVDWQSGDDDMWSRWTPLTPDEVDMARRWASLDDRQTIWNKLHKLMLRRERLVENPDGRFYWSNKGRDPCDLMPPG